MSNLICLKNFSWPLKLWFIEKEPKYPEISEKNIHMLAWVLCDKCNYSGFENFGSWHDIKIKLDFDLWMLSGI